MPRAVATTDADPRHVLTGAVLRACALLDITQSSLAQILGLSPATISRMAGGRYALDTQRKEWELGGWHQWVPQAFTGGDSTTSKTAGPRIRRQPLGMPGAARR